MAKNAAHPEFRLFEYLNGAVDEKAHLGQGVREGRVLSAKRRERLTNLPDGRPRVQQRAGRARRQ